MLRGLGIEIQVSDNGKGFAGHADGLAAGGFGLNGMAERARMLGGRFSLRAAPGHGTIVHTTIPVGAAEQA